MSSTGRWSADVNAVSGKRKRTALKTHLLPCNQQDGALLGMHHLPENVVKDEKLAPAILKKFHLVINLK